MPTLAVFNNISLDGYFSGAGGDIRWAYDGAADPEFAEFSANNAKNGGALMLGRKTYDMMVRYWPTDAARAAAPDMAQGMNEMPKFVFSNTLKESPWQNTTILSGDLVAEVTRIKNASRDDITILGSGSLIAPLADAGLLDGITVVVNPVVLGEGRTMFEGLRTKVKLTLETSRAFDNGKIFLSYSLK